MKVSQKLVTNQIPTRQYDINASFLLLEYETHSFCEQDLYSVIITL
jgi:hypothetical protein